MPLSSLVLSAGGIILMGIGVYFFYFRPPLLPEDLRYMQTSLMQIEAHVPGLLLWLKRVFWVMGAYIFSSGLLTVYLALTGFQRRMRGAAMAVALAGAGSVGVIASVNFILNSDFKWHLLALAFFWVAALILYSFEKSVAQS